VNRGVDQPYKFAFRHRPTSGRIAYSHQRVIPTGPYLDAQRYLEVFRRRKFATVSPTR
jgi:hypothetical protein